MGNLKKIALIALGLAEVALPMATLIGGCFVAGANTFWCALLIACAIVFVTVSSSWCHGAMGGDEKDWKQCLQLIAMLGAVGSFLVIAVEFLYFGYISKHQLGEAWPMAMSSWYLFTIMTASLLTVSDWHKEDKKTKFFLTCAVVVCVSIAAIAGLGLLDVWFGCQLIDTVGEAFGYVVGTTIIILIAGIAAILADQTTNGQNTLTERWASACGAICCIGFVGAMLTGAASGWGFNIPDALQRACLWLIGGGFIGLIFSAVIALIKK